jgi:hypothetical protein
MFDVLTLPVDAETTTVAPALYAAPRLVTDINDCFFYHTMDLPGIGPVPGQWDLRGGVREYLGDVRFRGKRVLEMGTADGFLCFQMELRGAEVVAFDLSEHQSWDIVPSWQFDYRRQIIESKSMIRRLNNAFWYCHKLYRSRARMVYESVYSIPPEIGPVDITTFGCILLHLRDPFQALQNALRLTRETVIITEPLWPQYRPLYLKLIDRLGIPYMRFLARHSKDSWWLLPPSVLKQFLAVLGFERCKVSYHRQLFGGRWQKLYTLTAERTRGTVTGEL